MAEQAYSVAPSPTAGKQAQVEEMNEGEQADVTANAVSEKRITVIYEHIIGEPDFEIRGIKANEKQKRR